MASVFIDPPFYAKVASVTQNTVTIEFGEHYKLLHGASTRTFTATQANANNIFVIPDASLEPWQLDESNLHMHNQLLAHLYSGGSRMKDRLWLKRNDGKDYVSYFNSLSDKHGRRYAMLWLCHAALTRLRSRPALPPLGPNATAPEIKQRLKDALIHATKIVPPWIKGKLDDDDDEDSADEDDAEESLECAGFPEGWTFGWSASRTVPLAANARKSFRQTWWLFKATKLPGAEIVLEHSDPEFEDSLAMKRASLANSWTNDAADTLLVIAQSSLLNRAQLSGLYSSIGTRCHYRLAAHTLVGNLEGVPPGPTAVSLAEYDANQPFFAPLAGTVKYPYRVTPAGATATREWFDFAAANDSAISYSSFTGFAESSFDKILSSIFSRVTKTECECEIVGIEVPLYNPYCVFTKHKTFKFFQTQVRQTLRLLVLPRIRLSVSDSVRVVQS